MIDYGALINARVYLIMLLYLVFTWQLVSDLARCDYRNFCSQFAFIFNFVSF